jgi:hypothetical protein
MMGLRRPVDWISERERQAERQRQEILGLRDVRWRANAKATLGVVSTIVVLSAGGGALLHVVQTATKPNEATRSIPCPPAGNLRPAEAPHAVQRRPP